MAATVKTRIQLKCDTEENWNKAGPKEGSPGFIPLKGELIVYSADESHPFSRIKIGDGVTNVIELPFLHSEENESIKVLEHKLTFGAGGQYVFDGSKDVTVPVYTGTTT